MKKVLKGVLAVLAIALLSLPASATYIQLIDDFESGSLGSWSIEDGVAADAGAYNAISSYYGYFGGPILYYPSQGDWMMVLNGGSPKTTVETDFTAYQGAQLLFSWFFSTLDAPSLSGKDDRAGFLLNGSSFILAKSSTAGSGAGADNTGWMDFALALPAGPVELGFWAENIGDYLNDPRLAIDNIRVSYADIPSELQGGGGDTGGGNTGGGNGGGTTSPIPEPSTIALFSLGLVGLSVMRIRRRESFAANVWKPTEFPVIRV